MQTGTREYLGKNKFWTPSNIAITQSIVDSSIAKISLTDSNSTELFSVTSDSTAIQTKDNVPLQASQFIITGTNAEIDEDENNAVNKRYLVDKITPLDSKFMTQAQCDERYYDKDTVDEKLATKVNNDYLSQNYYDKGTIDITFADYYTKDEVDTNISTVNNNFSNYYTKTEVDTKLSENQFDANNYYDKDTLDNYLSLKADKNFVLANYYNRTDMDAKLATKATTTQLQEVYQNTYNKGQVYNKTEIDTTLGNYYTKTEIDTNMTTVNGNFENYYDKDYITENYYTKTQINSRVPLSVEKTWTTCPGTWGSYIAMSSNEVLITNVPIDFSTVNTSPTEYYFNVYLVKFNFSINVQGEDLTNFIDNKFIKYFVLKIDDGFHAINGWWQTDTTYTSSMYVYFTFIESTKYVASNMSIYFVPKNTSSTISVSFSSPKLSIRTKRVS